MCDARASEFDEQGMLYSQYPECPNPDCEKTTGVGRNYLGKTDDPDHDMNVDEWYCYCCCQTF